MSAPLLSFKEAAKQILKEAKEPLTPKEIMEAALEAGLLETQGATPDASMAAQLYVDIQKNPASVFKKVAKGSLRFESNRSPRVQPN